jgi:hypothetical protein
MPGIGTQVQTFICDAAKARQGNKRNPSLSWSMKSKSACDSCKISDVSTCHANGCDNACDSVRLQLLHLDRGGNAYRLQELSERKERHLALCCLA